MKVYRVLIIIGFLTVMTFGFHLNLTSNGVDIGLSSNRYLSLEIPVQYFYYNETDSPNNYKIKDHWFGTGIQLFWFSPKYKQASISFGSGISVYGAKLIKEKRSYGSGGSPQVLVSDGFTFRIDALTIQPEFSFYDEIFSVFLNYCIFSWDPLGNEFHISVFSRSPSEPFISPIKVGFKWNVSKFVKHKRQENNKKS